MSKSDAFTPLISLYRSSVLEVTFSGIIAVVNGQGKVLLQAGDINKFFWTRSVLKPLQLLSHLDLLKKAYPKLTPEHFALMSSSHSGEERHLKLLAQIMEIGGISPSDLKCPASMSLDPDRAALLRHDHVEENSSFHNCSGKHSGYLLAVKAGQAENQAIRQAMDNYLDPDGAHFESLLELLSLISGREKGAFMPTIDGCRLPNYALSSREIAQTYCALTRPIEESVFKDRLVSHPGVNRDSWQEPAKFMAEYPEVIGGTNRLDTKIMQGKYFDRDLGGKAIGKAVGGKVIAGKVIAKQGAEGLLAIGIENVDQAPGQGEGEGQGQGIGLDARQGLGILIKLASGWDTRAMEILAKSVFETLGLKNKIAPSREDAHIETRVHFNLEPVREG
jgi:L-asparaginase II